MAKPKSSNLTYVLIIVIAMLAISIFVSLTRSGQLTGYAGLYTTWNTSSSNVTVNNAAPTMGTVTLEDYPNDATNASQITLYGGTTKTVYCNATVTDTNGWLDISVVNATIYYNTTGFSWTNNYTSVYTNLACTNGTNTSQTAAPWSCSISMQFNANNGTWDCTLYAKDTAGSVVSGNSSNVQVLPLTAINVDPYIGFGNMALGATSAADINQTIYNYGNIQIDLKLNGTDLDCASPSIADIPVANMRFTCTTFGTTYANMSVLSGASSDTNCTTFDLAKNTTATGTLGASTRNLPWKIQVPASGIVGYCNGTVWLVGEPG